jgi:uncharacterized cupin superfamily protein
MENVDIAALELKPLGVKATATEGSPADSCTEIIDDDHLDIGVWECTPGTFTSQWPDVLEVFTVLEGRGKLIDGSGTEHELRPGIMQVIPPGSTGTWVIEETIRKSYVIVKDAVKS